VPIANIHQHALSTSFNDKKLQKNSGGPGQCRHHGTGMIRFITLLFQDPKTGLVQYPNTICVHKYFVTAQVFFQTATNWMLSNVMLLLLMVILY